MGKRIRPRPQRPTGKVRRWSLLQLIAHAFPGYDRRKWEQNRADHPAFRKEADR